MRWLCDADSRWLCKGRVCGLIWRDDVSICGKQHCQCDSKFWKAWLCTASRTGFKCKNIENEREIVEKAVQEIGTQIVCYVPRSSEIQEAENQEEPYLSF